MVQELRHLVTVGPVSTSVVLNPILLLLASLIRGTQTLSIVVMKIKGQNLGQSNYLASTKAQVKQK